VMQPHNRMHVHPRAPHLPLPPVPPSLAPLPGAQALAMVQPCQVLPAQPTG